MRPGPKRASKLTAQVVEQIRGLDAAGRTLTQIAAAAGVSTFSVRRALGPGARQGPAAAAGGDQAGAGAAPLRDERGDAGGG